MGLVVARFGCKLRRGDNDRNACHSEGTTRVTPHDRSGQHNPIHSPDRHIALPSTRLIHQPPSMLLGEFMILPSPLRRTATPRQA
jgi:hypothetical protein